MSAGPSAEQVDRFRADLSAFAGDSPSRVGIAFSGGPDSLALLLLADAALPGAVEAATVDHGLRPESAEEARIAASLCADLGIAHQILRPADPIQGNIQSGARRMRYSLLEHWRGNQRIDWILTGHHADDQAETLLMRLNRGSGVGGLGGIRARRGRVLRPLLGWRRAELAAIVAARGIVPILDPSNEDQRFDRARLRQSLADIDWIDPAALGRSALAAAEADEALGWAADQAYSKRAIETGASVEIDPDGLPRELRRRLLARALRHLAPGAEPRGEELSRLLASLERGQAGTLSGIKAQGGARWRLAPAPPRRRPPE